MWHTRSTTHAPVSLALTREHIPVLARDVAIAAASHVNKLAFEALGLIVHA